MSNGAPAGSPLAAIRGRLAEKQFSTTEDIELPGALEGELSIRFRALGYEESERIANRERTGPRAGIDHRMSELINACRAVLYKDGDKWAELVEDGKPVRIDARLAAALEIPVSDPPGGEPDTHVILRGLYALAAGGKGPDAPEWQDALTHADHMIETVHTFYRLWLKGGPESGGAEQQVAEEMLGESSATLA